MIKRRDIIKGLTAGGLMGPAGLNNVANAAAVVYLDFAEDAA